MFFPRPGRTGPGLLRLYGRHSTRRHLKNTLPPFGPRIGAPHPYLVLGRYTQGSRFCPSVGKKERPYSWLSSVGQPPLTTFPGWHPETFLRYLYSPPDGPVWGYRKNGDAILTSVHDHGHGQPDKVVASPSS